MFLQKFTDFLTARLTRIVSWMLIIIILVVNIFTYYFYLMAEATVMENDLENIPNRSVREFFFAPLLLQRGETIKKQTVIDHLKSIAYQEAGADAGGFIVNNNQLIINSRFPNIFPNATVTFSNNRIISIAIDNQSVDQILIEPLSMRTDIHFVYGADHTDDPKVKDQTTRRIVIKPENVPQIVKDVITSSEDYKFFVHQGIDWIALPKRFINGNGGSTINSQIAKNNFYYGAKTSAFWNVTSINKLEPLERKLIAEPFIALALDQNMRKDEIFAAYLNLIPYAASNGIELQGILSASHEFFGKSQLSELTLAEISTLAAMINRPGAYLNYVKNGNSCPGESNKQIPNFLGKLINRFWGLFQTEKVEDEKKLPPCKDLLSKRNIVLDLVYRNHPDKYSKEMIEEAKATPLKFVFASEHKETRPVDTLAQRFAGYALDRLPEEVKKLNNEEGNIKITTSLNSLLQQDAFEISENALRELQPKIDKVFRKQKAENPEIIEKIKRVCDEQNLKDREQGRQPSCDAEKLFKPQIGLVAIDAKNGEILVMIGGINTQFNFATMANRSPASAIKPFFYLKAIESGKLDDGSPITAATYIDKNIEKGSLGSICVADEANLGGSGSLRHQLKMSSNIGACVAAESAGIPTDFVGRLLKNNPPKSLQSALGVGAETTLLNLVQAYTIFPNNGKFVSVTAYKNAYQDDKRIVFASPNNTIRTNPEATFIVTDIMKSVVKTGTAAGFRQLAKFPEKTQFAGKTGSGMTSDLLFVGFTPRIIVGVWVGIDKNFPEMRMSDGFTGGKIVAPIAGKFMQSVSKYRPDLLQGEFVQPNNVIKLRVSERGCLVRSGGKEEFFIVGREPKSCN